MSRWGNTSWRLSKVESLQGVCCPPTMTIARTRNTTWCDDAEMKRKKKRLKKKKKRKTRTMEQNQKRKECCQRQTGKRAEQTRKVRMKTTKKA